MKEPARHAARGAGQRGGRKTKLELLHEEVAGCDKCPRLRQWCTQVAREKRKAFREWEYWGRPVPGFGDPKARIWIVGLAPAAHGANRTGRMFTGDRSGDFLYAALHRVGLANQATAVHREDGLELRNVYISATARCAPPANKPTPEEIANCAPFLDAEWKLLRNKRVLFALGKIGWEAALGMARRNGVEVDSIGGFAHGAVKELGEGLVLIGSYHVSQQNTFTGKLTEKMFDEVLRDAVRRAGG